MCCFIPEIHNQKDYYRFVHCFGYWVGSCMVLLFYCIIKGHFYKDTEGDTTMSLELPRKIHIIGSVGSGKTTLARSLSKMLQLSFHELDNVVWIRNQSGDIRRTEQERQEYLQCIIQTDGWIIEGIHQEEWVAQSFQQADCIIFLDTPYKIRTARIIKRFVKQKIGIEKAHYQPTFSIFFKMFRWNKRFEEVGKPQFFTKREDLLDKVLLVQHQKDVDNYFRQFQSIKSVSR